MVLIPTTTTEVREEIHGRNTVVTVRQHPSFDAKALFLSVSFNSNKLHKETKPMTRAFQIYIAGNYCMHT